MAIQCIITGCALVAGARWVAGDLFDAGSCYIFNGNHEDGLPLWCPLPPHYTKRLEPHDWWEKRGVFVIEKTKANLNQAAASYINGGVL